MDSFMQISLQALTAFVRGISRTKSTAESNSVDLSRKTLVDQKSLLEQLVNSYGSYFALRVSLQ